MVLQDAVLLKIHGTGKKGEGGREKRKREKEEEHLSMHESSALWPGHL